MQGRVIAVCRDTEHGIGKAVVDAIALVAGEGVAGDAHAGVTVKHRSRVRRDPTQPNLRQVHLIHAELHDELRAAGFAVAPGAMGENIATRGLDLLALPAGTLLELGRGGAVVRVEGLRNPCAQLEEVQRGLMQATLARDEDGGIVRKAGVMGTVVGAGEVRAGDAIAVRLPSAPHRPLAVV